MCVSTADSPPPAEPVASPDAAAERTDGGDEDEKDVSDVTPDELDSTEEDGASIEEKLTLATSSKLAGNAQLQAAKFRVASNHYKKGLKQIKSLPTSTHGVPELRKALNLNLALALMKLGSFHQSCHAAEEALLIEPANIKALFRRGYCRARTGEYAAARLDLLAVCKADPANVEARGELETVKAKLVASKAAEKKSFMGLFDKATGLYSDVEAQMAEKRKAEERVKQERKLKWEQHCAAQLAADVPEEELPTFEDWDALEKAKEKEAKEKKEKELEEKRKADKPDLPRAERKRRTSEQGEEELTEEEKK
eukprot:Selendium_serpulae@DN653_c0_g1_i1.p2